MSRLDEIKARAEKATPGPWTWDEKHPEALEICCDVPGLGLAVLAQFIGDGCPGSEDAAIEDMIFSAHAREDVPCLLEIVRDLKVALELIALDRPTQRPASIAERALARLRSGEVEEN